ncbi:MAG: trehalose-phosphatase [Candidatus Zixiibacteriota bacterium]
MTKRLWIFDFDGTLSEFVADRGLAALLPEARSLLNRLKSMPATTVAIISSRKLDDIVSRVDVSGIYLGGSCGLFWRTPHGDTLSPPESLLAKIRERRNCIMPDLVRLFYDTPVELEDKSWAVTAHLRDTPPNQRDYFAGELVEYCAQRRLFHSAGQLSLEVSFDEEVRKVNGLKRLLAVIGDDYEPHHIIYAGDDENDAQAIKWLTSLGGAAFTVGAKIAVPDVESVASPKALVQRVTEIIATIEQDKIEERS